LADHAEKTARLLADLAVAQRSGSAGVGLAKKTSNLFRDRGRKRPPRIDLGHFNRVIAVDPDAGIVEAEGMTTYADLADATLALGTMPAVVPQLKSITLGGAVAGVGIEATSFRQGLVHDTVVAMDILTGDGRIVRCTADNEHRDLFRGFPNSYGTLGYALKLTARTLPVRRYVHAPYLINVASANNRVRIPSRKILQDTCDAAAEIGATAVIVHGGHADDFSRNIEVGRHSPNHCKLLEILFAKQSEVRPDREQKLGDHRCHAIEMTGPSPAFPAIGNPGYVHRCREAVRIDVGDGRHPQQVTADILKHPRIVRLAARIASEILVGAELGRVDEDRDRDPVRPLLRLRHKRHVPGVEGAHRRHQR